MTALSNLYIARAELNLKIWQAEKDAEAETLAITPAEGWPGKNAEQREVAKAAALASNPIIHAATVQADACRAKLMTLVGQIEAAEAERRDSEWLTRARMVEALERRNIYEDPDDRLDPGFDGVTQVNVLNAIEEELPF